jgi:riboflavin biosynthesis protein RibD
MKLSDGRSNKAPIAGDQSADPDPSEPSDKDYMRRALDLASRALGRTAPNPPVGCVLVKDKKIIGEGFHRKAGEAHAEANAIVDARKQPIEDANRRGYSIRGATAYVTLEPCAHEGRTPSCAKRLCEEGVSRVVIGARDPHPKAKGGAEILKAAGIEVEFLQGLEEIEELVRPFFHWLKTGLPFVTVKVAMSSDGKIAESPGKRSSISGALAQSWVHGLRNQVDAVAIGSGTLNTDDPLLTVRAQLPKEGPYRGHYGERGLKEPVERRNPLRVLFSGKNPLNPNRKLFLSAEKDSPVLIFSPSNDSFAAPFQSLPLNLVGDQEKMGKDSLNMRLSTWDAHSLTELASILSSSSCDDSKKGRFVGFVFLKSTLSSDGSSLDALNSKNALMESLQILGKMNVQHLLVEAGPKLFESLFKAGCVQKLITIVSPKALGSEGVSLIPNKDSSFYSCPKKTLRSFPLGEDLWTEYLCSQD